MAAATIARSRTCGGDLSPPYSPLLVTPAGSDLTVTALVNTDLIQDIL